MRHIQATDATCMQLEPPKLRNPGEEVAQSPLLLRMQRALPLPLFLHRALNRWQYGSPDATAMEAMLLALKVATESYLEGPIAVADLAVPFSLAQSGEQLLSSASSIAGFERVLGTPIAGQAAARANGIGACHYYPEKDHCNGGDAPQLILTVDYSRAALTAILWLEDAGVFEERRMRHDVDLGGDALYRCHHSRSEELCYERLAEALRQVVKMPLEDTGSNVPGMAEVLILLGERATDGHLKEALQQVLQEQTGLMSIANPEWEEIGICNPVFAAARGIAEASWQRQKEPSAKNDL